MRIAEEEWGVMASTEKQLIRLFKTIGLVKIVAHGKKNYIKIIDRYGSLQK